jgi:ferritin-like metal-binding protein YciE/gas vesicle protein
MKLETLRKLYITQLRDIYDSENQILAAMPKMAAAASHQELKQAFNQHLAETKEQVNRLEKIFESLGESPKGETCEATQGLIKEAKEVLSASGDDDVIDAGLIGAAQKVEHYEIANYGTVVTYARMLGENQASSLLQQTLAEEKNTDKRLTMLATRLINRDANNAYSSGSESSYSSDSSSSSSSSSGGNVSLLSLLLGAAAGIAAGMLLAPSSGTETRNMLADKANSLKDQLGDTYNNLTGKKSTDDREDVSLGAESTSFGAQKTSFGDESTSFGDESTSYNRGTSFDANNPDTYGRDTGI